MAETFSTPEEVLVELGERVRRLRVNRNLSQQETALRAGISLRALRTLESGANSQLLTFIRVLKALDALSSLDTLAPAPGISPMAMLTRAEPQRAAKARQPPKG